MYQRVEALYLYAPGVGQGIRAYHVTMYAELPSGRQWLVNMLAFQSHAAAQTFTYGSGA